MIKMNVTKEEGAKGVAEYIYLRCWLSSLSLLSLIMLLALEVLPLLRYLYTHAMVPFS